MKRSIALDLFKIILSLFVIMIHLQPLFESRNLSEWMICAGLCSLAVPCFFIINGYFLATSINDIGKIKKYLVHLLVVYGVWSLFYLYFYYQGNAPKTIIFNLIWGYYHLWYLPALIFSVIALFFLNKYIKKSIYLLLFILIIYAIGHFDEAPQTIPKFLSQHGNIFRYMPKDVFYRNGLFMGLPLVTMGYLIRKFNIQRFFRSWHLVVIVLVALCVLVMETYPCFPTREVHALKLSNPIFGSAMLLLLIKNPLAVNKTTWTEYFGYIPNGVYYIHLFFIFKFFSEYNNIYNIPAVFVSSVLATIVLVFINKRVSIFL